MNTITEDDIDNGILRVEEFIVNLFSADNRIITLLRQRNKPWNASIFVPCWKNIRCLQFSFATIPRTRTCRAWAKLVFGAQSLHVFWRTSDFRHLQISFETIRTEYCSHLPDIITNQHAALYRSDKCENPISLPPSSYIAAISSRTGAIVLPGFPAPSVSTIALAHSYSISIHRQPFDAAIIPL